MALAAGACGGVAWAGGDWTALLARRQTLGAGRSGRVRDG
jgi:biotin-(acetyl-CoA carboxylase) ligase